MNKRTPSDPFRLPALSLDALLGAFRTLLRRPKPLTAAAFSLAACLAACHIGDEVRYEERATFADLYDSLKRFERVVIVFENGNGRVLDTVFSGPVPDAESLDNLLVEDWDGGLATILISGFVGGKEVYTVAMDYDGKSRKTQTTRLVRSPDASLAATVREFILFEGDSLPLPAITVTPAQLADQTLIWSSTQPEVAEAAATHLKGRQAGTARITARLRSDETKALTFTVVVEFNTRIPEAIAILPDTIRVAAGGASHPAWAKASPASSSSAVTWSTDHPATATVGLDGTVRGIRNGSTRLRAVSRERSSVADSALILVSDPVPAQAVRFLKDSTLLYLGGAAESILVAVLPPEARQEVVFGNPTSGAFVFRNGRIEAEREGEAFLVATSVENPNLADTLRVRVLSARSVDSVRIAPRQLRLYVGGESGTPSVQVFPTSAPEAVRWISGNPALARVDAAGRVSPVAAGNLRIHALSAADSLVRDSVEVRIKLDAPVITAGEDTVIAVGQTLAVLPEVGPQEYGLVSAFKWDLDGDMDWDDSATALKTVSRRYTEAKVHTARFLVRDTEGNESIARKQVRVVPGKVVLIISPRHRSYSREARIGVRWSVDGVEQDSLVSETLVEGLNTLTRSVPDPIVGIATTSITVTLDSSAPQPPLVKGMERVATAYPSWIWSTGGSGGSGIYRVVLDGADIHAASETRDTVFVPGTALAEGLHTLHVQERDAAGNWSLSGRHDLRVDLTPPAMPVLTVEPGPVGNLPKPTFRWKGGGGGMSLFQYRLGADPSWTPTSDLAYTPSVNLPAGAHVFQVRERDSVGHWSSPAQVTATLDFTPPDAPRLSGTSPTSAFPQWSWTSGGNGGSGDFRFKLGGDGNPAAGGTETRALVHTLTEAVSGTTYTLHLQERDAAGNWSTVISHAILHDKTRPSVAIRTPLAAGLYLTRQASVDVSGTSSKPEGGAPIQKITYTLDGVTGSLPTNLAPDGSWVIRALPLVNEKTLELKVTATDQGGNTGDAILLLAMDSTAPPPPVFATQPPALVLASDPRTSLEWTWTRGGAATDSFIVRLNGAEVARQSATTFAVGNLVDGSYALQIVEVDLAGNASVPVSATVVTVDRSVPPAPSPSATSPTRDSTPTWTWTASMGGTYEYRLARDAAPSGLGAALPAATFTPSTPLQDGAWQFQVRERDAAGNWSAWSATSIVVLKRAPPATPTVSRNAPASNSPRWSWVGGGGGNRTFRYRWTGATTYLGEGASTEYAPGNLPEQSHALCVSERDTVGYGEEDCESITVDRTDPAIAGISVPEGFITNRSPISIRFTRDATADSLSCDLTDGASTVCQRVVSDAAGNSSTVSRTVWYRSNVVFVKAGGAGARDGASWADAFGDIGAALTSIEGRAGQMEVWVSEGNYPNFSLARSFTSIFGGFRSTGSPNSIELRDPFTRVSRIRADSSGSIVRFSGEPLSICRNTVLDGFHILEEVGQALGIFYAENAVVRNFWIERNRNESGGAGLIAIAYSTCSFEKVIVRDNSSTGYAAVYLFSGGSFTMSNSEVSNNLNESSWGTAGILSEYGGNVTLRATRLTQNVGGSRSGEFGPFYQAYNHGQNVMDIDSCVIQGLRTGVYPEADSPSIIWGSGNSEP